MFKNSDKPEQPSPRTIRIKVDLLHNNQHVCPEINYRVHLALIRNEKPDEKFAKKSTTNHFRKTWSGYDLNDTFIDDTEAFDEEVPENLTPCFGGYYVNCGPLTFRDRNKKTSEEEFDTKEERKKERIMNWLKVVNAEKWDVNEQETTDNSVNAQKSVSLDEAQQAISKNCVVIIKKDIPECIDNNNNNDKKLKRKLSNKDDESKSSKKLMKYRSLDEFELIDKNVRKIVDFFREFKGDKNKKEDKIFEMFAKLQRELKKLDELLKIKIYGELSTIFKNKKDVFGEEFEILIEEEKKQILNNAIDDFQKEVESQKNKLKRRANDRHNLSPKLKKLLHTIIAIKKEILLSDEKNPKKLDAMMKQFLLSEIKLLWPYGDKSKCLLRFYRLTKKLS